MSVDRKEMRTGLIRHAHVVVLPAYRLAFNKRASSGGVYANIMSSPDREVWGVAYLCNPEAIRKLDRFEGVHGGHYEHRHATVIAQDGRTFDALTYVAGSDHIINDGIPSIDYLSCILTGARDHGLPEEYVCWVEQIGTSGITKSE